MKRSHAVFLGATGLILAGAYAGQMGKQRIDDVPTADAPAEARIYTSLEECVAAHQPLAPNWQNLPGNANTTPPGIADCQRDFVAASTNHVQAAPKFNSQSDCEAQYGSQQCRPASFNGTSVFVPAMIGFMVANALSNRTSQPLLPPLRNGTACPPGQTPETMPGCTVPPRSSSSSSRTSGWSSFSTPSGHTVSRDTSQSARQAVTVPSSAAAAPVARSSIGAVAPRPSSWSRSSTTSRSSSSSSVSRSGFGSTGRSISSSSS